MTTSRPIRASIDLAALRHNFAVARRLAGAAKIWAVIKADAYGHGQFQVAQALYDLTDGYALLETETAVALRERGHRQPILLLEGFFAPEDIAALVHFDLTPTLHHHTQLDMLAAAPKRPISACIKLNTGMNRLGFRPQEVGAVRQRLQELGIHRLTLMNHFAEADTSVGIREPLLRVQQLRASDAGAGLPVSLANSAALIRYPESRGGAEDWVRPGIMLYGGSPFSDTTAAAIGLQPVMTLASRLIGIQTLQVGERVGYGGTFQTEKPMRIGIVACGYADGYPRHAPTGTPIAVAGVATRTLGRVSMDMLAVDLGDIPQAKVGSPVTLWGVGEGGTVDADAVAAAAGTISYELFCAVAPRVPRQWQGA
ncbi:alanine racemase [Betaproteobacteria bacterium]|nr:alanine racemase [Betaproteobacteria bacterium]GHU42596.1 alanine racemase [Betaproteobacteria bacterium]